VPVNARHRVAPSTAKQSRVRSASPTRALAENAKTVCLAAAGCLAVLYWIIPRVRLPGS